MDANDENQCEFKTQIVIKKGIKMVTIIGGIL